MIFISRVVGWLRGPSRPTCKYWYALTVESDAGKVHHEFGAETLIELFQLMYAQGVLKKESE